MKYLFLAFQIILFQDFANAKSVKVKSVVDGNRSWGKDKKVLKLCFVDDREGEDQQSLFKQNQILNLVHSDLGKIVKSSAYERSREQFIQTFNQQEKNYLKQKVLIKAVENAYNQNDIGLKISIQTSCPSIDSSQMTGAEFRQAFKQRIKQQGIDALIFLGLGSYAEASLSSIGKDSLKGSKETLPFVYFQLPFPKTTVENLRKNLINFTKQKNKNFFTDSYSMLDQLILNDENLIQKTKQLFVEDGVLSPKIYLWMKASNEYLNKNKAKEKNSSFYKAMAVEINNQISISRTDLEVVQQLYQSYFSYKDFIHNLKRLSQVVFLHELGHLLGLRHNFAYCDKPKGDMFISFDLASSTKWEDRHQHETHDEESRKYFSPDYYTSYDPFSIMSYGFIFSYRYIPHQLKKEDLALLFDETAKRYDFKLDPNIIQKMKKRNGYHFKVNISQGDIHTLRCLYKKSYAGQVNCRSNYHPLNISQARVIRN